MLAAGLTALLCQLFVAFPGQPESLAFVPLFLFKIRRKIIVMELQLQIYLDASFKGISVKDTTKILLLSSFIYLPWREATYCCRSISWTWSYSNPCVFPKPSFEEEQHQKWESVKDRKSELMVNSLKPTYAGYSSLSHTNLLPWLVSSLISSMIGQSWSLNVGWRGSIVKAGGTWVRSCPALISYYLAQESHFTVPCLSRFVERRRLALRKRAPGEMKEGCFSALLSFPVTPARKEHLPSACDVVTHLCNPPFSL